MSYDNMPKAEAPDYMLAYTAVISRACAAYAYLQCGEPDRAEDALKEVMRIMRIMGMVEGRPIQIGDKPE